MAGPRQAGRVGIGTGSWLWLMDGLAPFRGMHLDPICPPATKAGPNPARDDGLLRRLPSPYGCGDGQRLPAPTLSQSAPHQPPASQHVLTSVTVPHYRRSEAGFGGQKASPIPTTMQRLAGGLATAAGTTSGCAHRVWSYEQSSPAIRPGSTTPAEPGTPSAIWRRSPSKA